MPLRMAFPSWEASSFLVLWREYSGRAAMLGPGMFWLRSVSAPSMKSCEEEGVSVLYGVISVGGKHLQ
jgi:hypothetical protein